MNHTPLKEMTSHLHQWTIGVREVRFSECKNREQPPRVRLDFILNDEQVLHFYICLVVQSHISLYSFSVLVWKRSMLQLKKGKSKKGR